MPFPTRPTADAESRGAKLIRIGIALSSERDGDRLMESILLEAKAFTNADGGTLYLCAEDRRLRFAIVRNDSLDVAFICDVYGRLTGKPAVCLGTLGPGATGVASSLQHRAKDPRQAFARGGGLAAGLCLHRFCRI